MGAMRQKIGHRKRLRVRKKQRQRKEERERGKEREREGVEGKPASRNTGLYKWGRACMHCCS